MGLLIIIKHNLPVCLIEDCAADPKGVVGQCGQRAARQYSHISLEGGRDLSVCLSRQLAAELFLVFGEWCLPLQSHINTRPADHISAECNEEAL